MALKQTKNAITASIRRQQSELDKIPQQAYDFWVKITPKDTGNARRRTKLVKNEIQAQYPYAERLDQGWSKQFGGQGMSKPTERFIEGRLKQIMRK